MKLFLLLKLALSLLVVLSSINFLIAGDSGKPKMHALIIANSSYNVDSGWRKLSSANDTALMTKALEEIDGFKGNIRTVQNCTKEQIKKAISELTKQVLPGDVVVIHYSGHGAQIEYQNKKEGNSLDECWVPVDASVPSNAEQFKVSEGKYLRGREIGPMLDALRRALGKNGDLLILIDACCSSGSTRGRGMTGLGINRGLEYPILADPGKKFDGHKNSDQLFKEWDANNKSSDALSDYVVIAAAREQEADMEIKTDDNTPCGPLSYAFAKAISNLTAQSQKNYSYASLFESILLEMNKHSLGQRPEIEGTGKNKGIFGGKNLGKKTYFNVLKWESGNNKVVIEGGTVHGITIGSRIKFYPVSQIDLADSEVVEGTVESSVLFNCTVKLDKPIAKQDIVAFVKSYGTNNIPKVGLAVANNDKKITESLKKHFAKDSFDLVRLTGAPDLILEPADQDNWCIKVNGKLFRSGIRLDNDDAMNSVDSAVRFYAQYQYLQNLNITDTNIHARVEILSMKDGKVDSSMFARKNEVGTLAFDTGTLVAFHVINDCNYPIYINIVDMSPDGTMQTFLPRSDQDYPVTKCYIEPKGERYYYDKTPDIIYPPFGNEILKIFVTKDQMDLQDVINTRGADTRGPEETNNFYKIFKNSYNLSTRGIRAPAPNVSLNEGTIFSIPFVITDPAKKAATANK